LSGPRGHRHLTFLWRRFRRATAGCTAIAAHHLQCKDIYSQPADFRTTYFLAANGPRHEHAEAWKELTPILTIRTISGDHEGDHAITREPQVKGLAEGVVEALTAALGS